MATVLFVGACMCGLALQLPACLRDASATSYGQDVRPAATCVQSNMLQPLPGVGFGVSWRGAAFPQDASSPLAAPMANLLQGSHDSGGGWMSGGPAGLGSGTSRSVDPELAPSCPGCSNVLRP